MKLKNEISEFIKEAKNDIIGNEDNYCIVVLTNDSFFGDRLSKIYKNIDEFKMKAKEDLGGIDDMFSIKVQVWFFD